MSDNNRLKITPAVRLGGVASVPGDKSISHRLAMIGAIAEGRTTIRDFAESADCQSTLDCLRDLGVSIQRDGNTVIIEGRGLAGLRKPSGELDAGNSGTTVRLMSGIMAGFPFESVFVGDESLSRRPMKRIMEPLRRFGATLEARDDNYLPLKIRGGSLTPVSFTLPIASAQVKSAVLFAGLLTRGTTRVNEPVATRNHTEIALAEFGADIRTGNGTIEIDGGRPLAGKEFHVPGDLSSAAFPAAAALCVPNSRIELKNVGLNPTRSGFLSLLQQMGARISVRQLSAATGEPAGDITVESSELAGMEIAGSWIPNVIDEIPVLAVIGTRTRNGIHIRDAQELRAKESDRIQAVASNLRALGARVEEHSDGLSVPGGQTLQGGVVDSFGDHRIAMAFAVAGLLASGPVTILNPSCVGISFPGFFELLSGLTTG
ncbi:MAG TPA: 3-phosphoshikimate 1-carboxyvinyltransferase [Terriglobia bacterium]|nr:3-phosphoshikimate 1-carboxyvinyltransferase [Terriglobia bacterium]